MQCLHKKSYICQADREKRELTITGLLNVLRQWQGKGIGKKKHFYKL